MSEAHGFTPDETAASTAQAEETFADQTALRDDYIATFSSPHGEKVFEHLYAACRQNRSTYSRGQDVTHTAFLEGRRSVVLDIMAMLTLDDMTIIERARNRALRNR
jgi:hypothetical protein